MTRNNVQDLRDRVFGTIGARRYTTATVEPFGVLRIQSITEGERWQIEQANQKSEKLGRARMIALAVVDDDGNRVFGDSDIEALANTDASLTLQLSQVVAAHWANIPSIENHTKN